MSINGWASWCAYQRWQARLVQGDDEQIVHLLAVRLAWEWLLHEVCACQRLELASARSRRRGMRGIRQRCAKIWPARRRPLAGPPRRSQRPRCRPSFASTCAPRSTAALSKPAARRYRHRALPDFSRVRGSTAGSEMTRPNCRRSRLRIAPACAPAGGGGGRESGAGRAASRALCGNARPAAR